MSKGRGLFVASPCGEPGGEEGKNMKCARWWKELFVGEAVTGEKTQTNSFCQILPVSGV
jgi:hypothetical protein